ATCPIDWPLIVVPAGKLGDAMATTNSRNTTIASNTRSTTSDASDMGKVIVGSSRVSAYARANSPARAGNTLFTIVPMAVGRHNGPNGSLGEIGSRMVRQRRALSGNIIVATTADRTSRR